MSKEIPNRVVSMMKMKCPNCHKGEMYKNKSIFPIKEFMHMYERCPNCNLKYELETGFWFGTGYVSYILSVGIISVLAVLFAIFYGFSWRDNSIFIFIAVMVVILAFLQPFIMRFARVFYIYFFIKYGEGAPLKKE